MKEKVKYLSKNVFLFTLSSFVPKLLTLLLVKLYTNYLTTGDYGLSDLMNTTSSLLIPLLTIDIQDAVLRFGLDKKYDKGKILRAALKMNSLALAILIIGVLPIAYFKVFNIEAYFYLFLITYFISTSLKNTFTFFCKTIEKVNIIVISSIITTLVMVITNILFLVVFKLGVIGYLAANVLGIVISDIYIFFSAKLFTYINGEKSNMLREMISYSWPLIFNSISWWINDASDRYILTYIAGVSVSGIYAISYKIPGILSTFQTIFYQAWSISAIKHFDKKDSDGFIGTMFTMMNFCMCLVCSLIMIINVPLAKFLYSGEFMEAWKYVPPLLLSVVFNSMCLFIGGIFTAVKDTKAISLTTIIGALINIILNILLIPNFGAYGAAVATLIGYFTILIIRVIVLRKYVVMNTNMVINYLSYILLSVQMILAFKGNHFIIFEMIIFMILILLYSKQIKYAISILKRKIGVKFKKQV